MWMMKDDLETEFVTDIENYPDRVVGIVLGSIIDEQVKSAVKTVLFEDPERRNIFNESGPLGNWGPRNRLCVMVGLFGHETYADLERLRKIRNYFAHNVETKDFAHNTIRQLADALTTPSRHLVLDMGGVVFDLGAADMVPTPTPRSRFIRTIHVLNTALRLEAEKPAATRVSPRF